MLNNKRPQTSKHQRHQKVNIPLSGPERKLVVMESFSEVVYFAKIPARLEDHGSNVSSKSESTPKTADPFGFWKRNILANIKEKTHLPKEWVWLRTTAPAYPKKIFQYCFP